MFIYVPDSLFSRISDLEIIAKNYKCSSMNRIHILYQIWILHPKSCPDIQWSVYPGNIPNIEFLLFLYPILSSKKIPGLIIFI